jgi:hypothetical protein
MGLVPQLGKTHHIVALRHGKQVRYFIDGELAFDYEDETPHTRGQMGFCLWRGVARLRDFPRVPDQGR